MRAQLKNNFLNVWSDEIPLDYGETVGNQSDPLERKKMMKEKQCLGINWEKGQVGSKNVLMAELESELCLLQWREKTNQPVLFARWIGVRLPFHDFYLRDRRMFQDSLLRAPYRGSEYSTLQWYTQSSSSIHNFMPLSFSQHLYCLKEAAYGFQHISICFPRLAKGRPCVRVNREMKIKVWFNEVKTATLIQGRQNLQQGESGLVGHLLQMFAGYSLNIGFFRQFYQGIGQVHNFTQLIKYIDAFIEKNKIKLDKRITGVRSTRFQQQPPRSPKKRVPKFLSPCHEQKIYNNASARLSASPNFDSRRITKQSRTPSKKDSGILKMTVATEATDHKMSNLVKVDKQRKGSGNNFCFTSLHRLETVHRNLKSKASEICQREEDNQFQTMASLNAENSLLKNFDKLFQEQSQIDYLSVSINLQEEPIKKKPVKLKKLSSYGRAVNQSIINTNHTRVLKK